MLKKSEERYFNPHHPQGGDHFDFLLLHVSRISIHTTRKVVTSRVFGIFPFIDDFNPHHPQGGDSFVVADDVAVAISIHTTRKVVTVMY